LADPNYLTRFIQEMLLDNPHFVRVVLRPDKTLMSKELAEEHSYLKEIQESFTPKDSGKILAQTAELELFQKMQEEENIDVLPKISMQDIPLIGREFPLKQEKIGSLQVFHHAVFTNDIIYANLSWDLPDFPEEDLPFLSLLAVVITQMGSNGRDYKSNLEYIFGNTGGIDAGLSLNIQARDCNQFRPMFHLKGKALRRKASKLFPLLRDTLLNPILNDVSRLKEVLTKYFSSLEGQFTQNSLKYAVNLSASGINQASAMANQLYGLPYFRKIQELMRDFDANVGFIIEKLITLHKTITQWTDPSLVISCDPESYNELKGHEFYGLCNLELYDSPLWQSNLIIPTVHSQCQVIASPVAFIAKAFPTISYTHPSAPALRLASYLFDNLTLHNLIREQGGAYGGGAVCNSTSGNFYFYSFRDPNINSTIKAFEKAIKEISQGNFNESNLNEAKLELVQDLDSPVSPGNQADLSYNYYIEGKTTEMRQLFRSRMLAMTNEQISEAVTKYMVPNYEKSATVVFASKSLLEKENL
jgi:hypothetical protein